MTAVPALGPAIARLTQSLTELTASHTKNASSLTSLAEERSQLDAREAEMREMISKAEAKRSWFASFKEWIENVATFLDEKVPPGARSLDVIDFMFLSSPSWRDSRMNMCQF
jgi:GC-rich sequence DNA-binding factor